MSEKVITVALAGNPNVGKSTVFNSLTGMKQHTGNWTGKTVDLAQGKVNWNGCDFRFIDIPGTYSLNPHSEEERVADEYICFGNAEKVAVVCDATNLERNLYLVLQIMETGADMVVCVNLLDEAEKKGFVIDLALLEKELGVKVVGMTARNGEGIEDLLCTLSEKSKNVPVKIKYNQNIESAMEYILPLLKKYKVTKVNHRWLSLRLLEDYDSAELFLEENSGLSEPQIDEIKKSVFRAKEFLKETGEFDNISESVSARLYKKASEICGAVIVSSPKQNYTKERIFTNKLSAYPVMLLMLSAIFYVTIVGANYPSQWLSTLFAWLEEGLWNVAQKLPLPPMLESALIAGGFRVLGWVVSVMLPPMAIFFPCFTLLEDLGVLPRVSYVLDNGFRKANTCGKQALTTCMGFGCNCVGISGARIIDSKRERLIAVLTNSLTICNGRFPAIITLISVFLVGQTSAFKGFFSAVMLASVIVFSFVLTLLVSNILSKTLLKGEASHYILELPPYRKPQITKVVINSVFNRTLSVLLRAVSVAFPAGVVIWLLANMWIGEFSILHHISNFFEPAGQLMGMDGKVLSAFLLGIPANEIVLPIALMSYMGSGEMIDVDNINVIGEILITNGWTKFTAISYIIFSVAHFPCATALLTVFKETKSAKWTFFSFLIPTVLGVVLCFIVNIIEKFKFI